MENKILSILLSLSLILNACSAPKGETAAQGLFSIIWHCGGGACVGEEESTPGEGSTGGESLADQGGDEGHGSGGDAGDGEGRDHNIGDSSSGGSITKEQEGEYRRAAFERASNEALAVLNKVAGEERVPGWFSETTDFLPKDVNLRSSPEPLVDPSEVVRSIVTLSGDSQPSSYAGLEAMGLNNPYFGRPDYQSEHRKELSSLHQRLDMAPARGPQQYDVKKSAYLVLSETDKAYLGGDIVLGDDLRETARLLVDVATDVIPFTAIPRDFYRAVVGVDVVTGVKLTGFERAMAAGFFALGAVTGGGSNLLKTGIKQMRVLSKATASEIKLADGFVKALEKSPLPVEVLINGASEGVTLIGRDMARVTEVAASLRKEGILVNILEESKFSNEARRLWGLEIKNRGWLTPEQIRSTLKFKENREWIRNALERGDTILDLGDFSGKPGSAFYNMEKSETLRFYKEMVAK